MEIRPETLQWRDVYKLLTGSVVPRPIAFVSTENATGVRNLAAFSFFTAVCPNPFIVAFAPMLRGTDGQKKDTLLNIEETGQFVINVVTEDIVEAMNLTAPEYPPEVDEFDVSGLTACKSRIVRPPGVEESPIRMECQLVQVLSFGQEPGSGSLVLGKVVHMHVKDSVYQDGKIDVQAMKPVARMAGNSYCRVTDSFVLERPSLQSHFKRSE